MYGLTISTLSHDEARARGLQHIRATAGMFLRPGDVVVMEADGCPVIISTANGEVMVAHTEQVCIVDSIIDMWRRLGVISPLEITLSVHLYAAQAAEFVKKAGRAGLRYVWATYSITEFLMREKASTGDLVMIRRDS